jgi:hypothetical protein
VFDGDPPGDSARDEIDTGAGRDYVDTGTDDLPNGDDIDLGAYDHPTQLDARSGGGSHDVRARDRQRHRRRWPGHADLLRA